MSPRRVCIHNSIEKCGMNSEGEVRRFLDSCDILEYNCLREASKYSLFNIHYSIYSTKNL